MHGTVRMRVELEGETIVRADPEIGFLHRGFQKSCENVTWNQCLPYTDRLNYVSAIMNNFGFLKAVEKLIGLEIPERAQYIRVAASELHRMHDHLTCVGAIGLELGGFSAFLYAIEARELIMDRVSELTGARLTTSFGRVGRAQPRPPRRLDRAGAARPWTRSTSCSARWTACSPATASSSTGCAAPGSSPPRTRSTSASPAPACAPTAINYDVRKARPYWVYDRMDFDVPVGQNGDNYDRYLMRMEELKQSEQHRPPGAPRDAGRADHRRRLAHRAPARRPRSTAPSRASSRTSSWSWRASRSRRARSTTAPRRPTASWAGTW